MLRYGAPIAGRGSAMRQTILVGASLMMLAACGGSPDPVGENSAGSIRTTAVGNVVGAIPSPTPSPTAEASDVDAAIANTAASSNDVGM